MTKFLPKTTANITLCHILEHARRTWRRHWYQHPTLLQVVVSLRSTVSNGHPWKYAFVMSPDLTVRRSHETPWKDNVQPFDVTGWRIRSHTSGFLQISAADQSTLEQRSNMRTTFASFMLVFCRCRPTDLESVCVLEPTIVSSSGPDTGYTAFKMFPLVPFNLAAFRQTWLRELIRSLKIDVFGSLAFLLWSIFVTHTAVSIKKRSARLPRPSHDLVAVRQAQFWVQQYHCGSSDQ